MNCDKVLAKGTKVRVTEVEPCDVVRGVQVGDVAEVVETQGPLKGMFTNTKHNKVAWAHTFKIRDFTCTLGFHQVELID